MTGQVYLVGAGPGDPGLITVRGLEVLRACDVLLYDRLVPAALLDEASDSAEKIFVGKKPGEIHSRQVVADALMVSRALGGDIVVRLKGGDPFVFGRGGEEGRLLREAGVPFEVVPGISSAIAVPAYAGIPVTHRGSATSFAVITAREEEGRILPSQRWAELARGPDTLVLLMGVASLEEVARRLIEAGRDPATPAAVIEWGTTPRQRTVVGTLATISRDAIEAIIEAPATTVVGTVVNERSALNWFEARPFFGRRIVVTRPAERAAGLAGELAVLGADVVVLPAIEIHDPASWERADASVAAAAEGRYDAALFASRPAVERWFERAALAGHDARLLAGVRVGAVGPATAAALARRGVAADFTAAGGTGQSLVDALGTGDGTVLFPRAEGAPEEVTDALGSGGWRVDEVPVYRTHDALAESPAVPAALQEAFDAVTFTSPSGARSFARLLPPAEFPSGAAVVCIGPTTQAAAEEVGYAVTAVAAERSEAGLVAALRTALGA